MFYDFITKYTDIFVEKKREAFELQKLLTFFFQQKILAYITYFKMFEMLLILNNQALIDSSLLCAYRVFKSLSYLQVTAKTLIRLGRC